MSRPGQKQRRWTPEEDAYLRANMPSTSGFRKLAVEAAEKFGRTPDAVMHHMAVLRGLEVRVSEFTYKPEPVPRACLTCGTHFVADGRFNRVCTECKRQLRFKYAA